MNRELPALSELLRVWHASDAESSGAAALLAERATRLAAIRHHLDKLREDPPAFDRTDLDAVLGALGSAASMRRQILEANEVDVLVATLRTFLYDDDEPLHEKLTRYPNRVRYAGQAILAELWGWAHIDRWPRYHPSAARALAGLGWPLPGNDYLAFARAFSDLRDFYLAARDGSEAAGRPEVPLHLEMDAFLQWAAQNLPASPLPPAPRLPRRSYAIHEFGAPYDAAPAPRHAWPDRPLLPPTPDQMQRAEGAIRAQLALPPDVVRRAAAHLLAGRHLVLTGAPGTGKSHLAALLARELFGYYPMVVTATAEWSAFDVVGGLVPVAGHDGALRYEVRAGVVTEALRRNWLMAADGSVRADVAGQPLRVGATHEGHQWPGVWLVVDELNRADVDKAFGDLFTALESGQLRVPRAGTAPSGLIPFPRDFRMIATLNSLDRHFLFALSDALKRRFAFLEVTSPTDPDEECTTLRRRALAALDAHGLEIEPRVVEEALEMLYPVVPFVRALHPLGSAPLLAVLAYAGAASLLDGTSVARAVEEGVIAEILPQLETLRPLPLRLLEALWSSQPDRVIERLGEAVEDSYADGHALGMLHAVAARLDPAVAARAAALRNGRTGDPAQVEQALALVDALRPLADRLPARDWPRVSATLREWLDGRG